MSFDFFVADMFRINVHDRFDLRQDPIDEPSLSNVTSFARFTNTAGVTVTADLNTLVLTAGYDHFNYLTLGGQYGYLDRNAEQFLASAVYQLAPRTFIGVEGTATTTSYDQDVLGDAVGGTGGLYFDIAPTPYLRFVLRGGYQYASFRPRLVLATARTRRLTRNLSSFLLELHGQQPHQRLPEPEPVRRAARTTLGSRPTTLEVNFVRYNIALARIEQHHTWRGFVLRG